METSNSVELAAEIVAAFVANNAVPANQLSTLIETVHGAVARLANGDFAPTEPGAGAPAVPISQSITPDYLICLEDGRRFKSMRFHLARLGLSPERYREKWGLPPDYPMVAPNYALRRSAIAKQIGFRKDGEDAAEPPGAGARKRGRRRKAGTSTIA